MFSRKNTEVEDLVGTLLTPGWHVPTHVYLSFFFFSAAMDVKIQTPIDVNREGNERKPDEC